MSIERTAWMNGAGSEAVRAGRDPPSPIGLARHGLLIAGAVAIIAPTMIDVAQESWSTEQGAHGPVVVATGLWLWRQRWRVATPLSAPGLSRIAMTGYAMLLPLYVLARIISVIEAEALAMYGLLIVTAYWLIGSRSLRAMWFPIVYLLFAFPPPDTVVAMITQPLKIAISHAAIDLLHPFRYPVAASGVMITIGQYQVLIAQACAGLNSLISLSAIGLFYVYVRHRANWRYALILMLAIVPVAMLANFIRVLALILITYHFGEQAAQGFLHSVSGLVLFVLSVLGIFAVDALATPLRRRLSRI